MKSVFAIATNITSAIGTTTAAHWRAAITKQTGIREHHDDALSEKSFWASRIDAATWQHIHNHTRSENLLSPFEQLAIYSARNALETCSEEIAPEETVFILSSTKGNIEWLGEKDDERILLSTSARIIANVLGIKHPPILISHACVSGVTATIYALRLLQSGRYKHAIVTGADRFTKFVLNGFQSFQAIADAPCRPFDKDRTGINLGEAAATIILSATSGNPLAQLVSGSTSNDANHISGPSRTGEELALAIKNALAEAQIAAAEIGIISAHGTATPYNDEMESKAFALSGVSQAPLHSFKGFIGHTLGAAGVAESVMLIEALQQQQLIPSPGFETSGVPHSLQVTTKAAAAPIAYALKTASGFGGCNAATVWKNM
jgi:3-oxoacyl-[acyl-carrier-protein] synthase-1